MDGSEPADDDAIVAEGDVMCGDCHREERDDDDTEEESIGW